MDVLATPLQGLLLLTPQVFHDDRGYVFESFNDQTFERATGQKVAFVQDNHTLSRRNVLRGMHYQIEHTQGKLIRLTKGTVFDVSVDLRKSSPTFGRWFGIELTAESQQQIWIPPGFAHGFLTLTAESEMVYKLTDHFVPDKQRSLLWSDPEIGIEWPLVSPPILSANDRAGKPLAALDVFA